MSADSYEAQKFANLGELSTLIHTELFQFPYILGPKIMGSRH